MPRNLETVDIDDSLGKGLRRFLWEIVSNAAVDGSMFVFAGEFFRVAATNSGDARLVGRI